MSNLVDNAERHGRGLVRVAVCRPTGWSGWRSTTPARAYRWPTGSGSSNGSPGCPTGTGSRRHRQRSRARARRPARPAALGPGLGHRPAGRRGQVRGGAGRARWACGDPARGGIPAGRGARGRLAGRMRGQGTGPTGDPPVAPRAADGDADRDRTPDVLPIVRSDHGGHALTWPVVRQPSGGRHAAAVRPGDRGQVGARPEEADTGDPRRFRRAALRRRHPPEGTTELVQVRGEVDSPPPRCCGRCSTRWSPAARPGSRSTCPGRRSWTRSRSPRWPRSVAGWLSRRAMLVLRDPSPLALRLLELTRTTPHSRS